MAVGGLPGTQRRPFRVATSESNHGDSTCVCRTGLPANNTPVACYTYLDNRATYAKLTRSGTCGGLVAAMAAACGVLLGPLGWSGLRACLPRGTSVINRVRCGASPHLLLLALLWRLVGPCNTNINAHRICVTRNWGERGDIFDLFGIRGNMGVIWTQKGAKGANA